MKCFYNINSILGLLYHTYVDEVVNVSEVPAAAIFKIKICKASDFLCLYRILFRKNKGGRRMGVNSHLPVVLWNPIL
jgi:hypothetical protein